MYSFIGGAIGLALIISMVILEGKLAFKSNWRAGLIPIIAITLLIVCLLGYSVFVQMGYSIKDYKYSMNHGYYAEIEVNQSQTGKVSAFSDLQVYNANGELVDTDEFETSQPDLFNYKSAENYFIEELGLDGFSQSKASVSKKTVHLGSFYYTSSAILVEAMIFDAPLIIIYIFARLCIVYRRKKDEMRRLDIELGL